MTITDIPYGVVIDTTDDRETDIGFFIVMRDMYGERAIPEMGRMVLDFSEMTPRQIHEEKDWVNHMFNLR